MSAMIEAVDVSKTFKVSKRAAGIPGMIANMLSPQYEKKQAVKNVSFEIAEGEMVGFIGPNGAGKSTTIKMLSGILCPDSGEIHVNQYTPYKQRKAYVGSIGVVFGQKSQLQWDLPVIDTFELLKAVYGIPEQTYKTNLIQFTEMLDMGSFLQQPVRQLSLGQRMRADIAAALLHSPKIVFFDEPTIGVDVVGKETIRQFMRELNAKENVTMIFTTHDMQDIEKVCDRLIIIDKGEKVYDGSLAGIREQYGTERRLDVEFNYDCSVEPMENVEIQPIGEEGSRRKRFIFDNRKVEINELMDRLLADYSIRDINISEMELDSLIRKIYSGEVL